MVSPGQSNPLPAAAELGHSDDPRALIPGNPAAIQSKLATLDKLASGIDEASTNLTKIDTGHWQGSAGDAFRSKFHQEVPHWHDSSEAFDQAKKALQEHSYTLAAAQQQAGDAIDRFNKGQQATQAAQNQYKVAIAQRKAQTAQGVNLPPMAPFSDPGAGDRQEAQAILDDARRKVQTSGEAARAAIAAAGGSAPAAPGLAGRVGAALDDFIGEEVNKGEHFLGHAARAIGGIIKPILGVANPITMLTHPMQAEVNAMNMATGLVHAATHPVDLVESTLDTPEWSTDPAGATGEIAVNIGSMLIGGEGAAAKGAEVGEQGAKLASTGEKAVADAGGNLGKAAEDTSHEPPPLKPADWPGADTSAPNTPFGPKGSESLHAPEPPLTHEAPPGAHSPDQPESQPPVGHAPPTGHLPADHPPLDQPAHNDVPPRYAPDPLPRADARPDAHPADTPARTPLHNIGGDAAGMQQSLHGQLDHLGPHPDLPGDEQPAPDIRPSHDPQALPGHESPPVGHLPGQVEGQPPVGHTPPVGHLPADHQPIHQPIHYDTPGRAQDPLNAGVHGDPRFHASDADHQAFRDQVPDGVFSATTLERIRENLHQLYPDVGHIPDEELIALHRYTGASYFQINKALRDADLAKIHSLDPEIKNAVSGMNKLPDWQGTAEQPLVYRGINVSDPERLPDVLSRYEPGKIVSEPGFTSGAKDSPFKGNVQFIIEPHYGKDLEFLNEMENEVCWPPYNRFEVLGRKFDEVNDQWKIYLRDHGR